MTGADLGAGFGAGRTTNGDMGGSANTHAATLDAAAAAADQMAG